MAPPNTGSPFRFFIGIDSDGTVFDSMEIKHRRVFQPVAIEVFCLESVAEEYAAICESINLYSTLRGINRFEGLALAFKRISRRSPSAAERLDGQQALHSFIETGGPYSLAALEAFNRRKRSSFLDRVMSWSERSDALYSEIMEAESSPTFPGIKPILERAGERAEIAVISSSSRATLERDWGEAGLLPFVTRIEGQEQGSKTTQLNTAVTARRDGQHALMLGDAPSDLDAARAHGILFYPIIPGAEAASWKRFGAEALNRFLNGSYAGNYETELLREFENVLQSDEASGKATS